ncbi:MAG: hypothetical protein RI953_788 [Pseudomonadota bacterium]|jgi:hypothetical protein
MLKRKSIFSVSFGSILIGGFLVACGTNHANLNNSELSTVVGRGGAFWDNRVQFINAIPNPKDDTMCLYLSEYNRKTAPAYENNQPLNKEQIDFLDRAQREAVALTQYPVSAAALDAGLAKKEDQRRIRGGINNAIGALTTFFGLGSIVLMFAALTGPMAPGAFYGGMTALQAIGTMFGFNVFGAFTYSFLTGAAGGVGLLSQASRDFSPKNYDVRSTQAAGGLSSTNLNVTLAFSDVAKSLPAASNVACPKNMSAEEVIPFLAQVDQRMGQSTLEDFARMEFNVTKRTLESEGCSFSARIKGEKLTYSVTPRRVAGEKLALNVAVFVIQKNGSMHLIGETVISEQMQSDAGAGTKYAGDSELGSIAIWVDRSQSEALVPAKIAHKLPSGEFLGNVGQITGNCRL